jgi:hypothetical protein
VCKPGQHCVSGECRCDSYSCPNGCCRENFCETSQPDGGLGGSLGACGKNGRACVTCDLIRSDSCTSTGQCACGASPSCEAGYKCSAGVCVCDPATCSGCCSSDGKSCRAGTSNADCGKGGFECLSCPTDQTCTDGRCTTCLQSCPGCCAGSVCHPSTPGPCPPAGQSCPCGSGGTACISCSTLTTDTCNPDGSCSCGARPPCGQGQHCVNGQCDCDSTSCPTCCVGTSCVPTSLTLCGRNNVCAGCDPARADHCASGGCACGNGPECPAGQLCDGGTCHLPCTPSSCRLGCCQSNTCMPPTQTACGLNGSPCVNCTPKGDRCVAGQCRCGNRAPCVGRQNCLLGRCV